MAWNLTRLAECLVGLSSVEKLEPELNRFWPRFNSALAQAVLERLGLVPQDDTANSALVSALFGFMSEERPAYEQVYFDWRGGSVSRDRAARSPQRQTYEAPSFLAFARLLDEFEPAPASNLDDPYFAAARPLSMLVDDVEAIWAPIAENDDWSGFTDALDAIGSMGRAYGNKLSP